MNDSSSPAHGSGAAALGMEVSVVQVETLTRRRGRSARAPREDGSCVGAVMRGPLPQEAFSGGAVGSIVEAKAVEEDYKVDIGAESLGCLAAHRRASARVISSRWSTAGDGHALDAVGPTSG